MKQIIQKIWIVIAVLCTSLSAYAYDFEVDGIYYDVVSLQDLTCEVTYGDNKYIDDITIPSEVTYNNRTLSVTEIGNYAFRGCSSLTSVTIPNSVTSIGKSAFSGCSSLTSVTIPNSVTSIGNSAFSGCHSLTSVTIPNSVTSIGEYAFSSCSSLTSVTIPNSVTSIRESAFSGCSSLTSVTIPNSVTSIGKSAFSGCSSLTSVTIPNSVILIGNSAFSYCSSLTSIHLSDSLVRINYGLFYKCISLESLSIPGSVEYVSQFLSGSGHDYTVTFEGCTNLKMLRIEYSPEKLISGYNRDNYNEGFETCSWKDWTERIEDLYIDRALNYDLSVTNLKRLKLGESIQTVQIENVGKLKELTTIESHALVPPTLSKISNAQYMNLEVIVPEEALDAYKADPVWGKFWNLQAGVDGVKVDSKKEEIGRYDMNGRAVSEGYQGLVIVRFSDGTCKKMFNH